MYVRNEVGSNGSGRDSRLRNRLCNGVKKFKCFRSGNGGIAEDVIKRVRCSSRRSGEKRQTCCGTNSIIKGEKNVWQNLCEASDVWIWWPGINYEKEKENCRNNAVKVDVRHGQFGLSLEWMYKREVKSNGYSREMRTGWDYLDTLGEEITTTAVKKMGLIEKVYRKRGRPKKNKKKS